LAGSQTLEQVLDELAGLGPGPHPWPLHLSQDPPEQQESQAFTLVMAVSEGLQLELEARPIPDRQPPDHSFETIWTLKLTLTDRLNGAKLASLDYQHQSPVAGREGAVDQDATAEPELAWMPAAPYVNHYLTVEGRETFWVLFSLGVETNPRSGSNQSSLFVLAIPRQQPSRMSVVVDLPVLGFFIHEDLWNFRIGNGGARVMDPLGLPRLEVVTWSAFVTGYHSPGGQGDYGRICGREVGTVCLGAGASVLQDALFGRGYSTRTCLSLTRAFRPLAAEGGVSYLEDHWVEDPPEPALDSWDNLASKVVVTMEYSPEKPDSQKDDSIPAEASRANPTVALVYSWAPEGRPRLDSCHFINSPFPVETEPDPSRCPSCPAVKAPVQRLGQFP
jgi:hypothetical protein